MLELLVEPDATALIVALETLEAFTTVETCNNPKAEINDSKIKTLMNAGNKFFLIFILVTSPEFSLKMVDFQVSPCEPMAREALLVKKNAHT